MPLYAPGPAIVRVRLTTPGRQMLERARKGLRIAVRHDYRDILTARATGVTTGRLATLSVAAMTAALVVMAKAPVAGRSKTRLCPPLSHAQAAALAEAALADTLQAVAWTPAARRVLVLDGAPGPWLPAGFEVIAQRGAGLAERLAHATRDVGEALLVLGMDTPQITRALLSDALDRLAAPGRRRRPRADARRRLLDDRARRARPARLRRRADEQRRDRPRPSARGSASSGCARTS